MSDLISLARTFQRLENENRKFVLATVVGTEGSSYRRPGARMLVTLDGEFHGMISGGCMDSDLLAHAQRVVASGTPHVVRYDSSDAADLLWGLGLGCGGSLEILLEDSAAPHVRAHLAFLQDALISRIPAASATVFRTTGAACAALGGRIHLREGSDPAGVIEPPELGGAVRSALREWMCVGCSHVEHFDVTGGSADVLLEVLEPRPALVIFGGGADAAPLARIAISLGWKVVVADRRPAFASPERFPMADEVVLVGDGPLPVKIDRRTAVVVMTHRFEDDVSTLCELISHEPGYTGILGPKRRSERLLAEAVTRGARPSPSFLERLHAPVGLDLGADGPEEIAVSIVAEIRAVFSDRDGGFLRDRKKGIHEGSERHRATTTIR
ncbi:MAG: XdhC family protein [Thermoanaerobaculia bacterium]